MADSSPEADEATETPVQQLQAETIAAPAPESAAAPARAPPPEPAPAPVICVTANLAAFHDLQNSQWYRFEAAEESLFTVCMASGFAAARRRSENQDPATGEYKRFVYCCHRGGSLRPHVGSQRRRSTEKTGCGWTGALTFSRRRGTWGFGYVAGRSAHNHALSDNAAAITKNRTRALRRRDVVLEVRAAAADPGNSAADIVRMLRGSHPEMVVYNSDVINMISAWRREEAAKAAAATTAAPGAPSGST